MAGFQSLLNNILLTRIPNIGLSKGYQDKINVSQDRYTSVIVLVNIFLRIGIFGTFLGHGINAILVKASWIHLITAFGFSNEFSIQVMPIIGILDVIVALSILIYPLKPVLIWAVFWAFITALSRPISGEPYIEFIERSANWVAPLVLLLLSEKR